jgi:hypothetical protein
VPAHPNPTQLLKPVDAETVAQHRSLFCTQYDDCLDHALSSAWRSWSCERCALYALRHRMAAQYARLNYHPAQEAEAVIAA